MGDLQTQTWVGGCLGTEQPFTFQPTSSWCLGWDLSFFPPRVPCVQRVCMIQVSVFTIGRSSEPHLIKCLIVFPRFLLWKKMSTTGMSRRVQLSSVRSSFKPSDYSGCTYGCAVLSEIGPGPRIQAEVIHEDMPREQELCCLCACLALLGMYWLIHVPQVRTVSLLGLSFPMCKKEW